MSSDGEGRATAQRPGRTAAELLHNARLLDDMRSPTLGASEPANGSGQASEFVDKLRTPRSDEFDATHTPAAPRLVTAGEAARSSTPVAVEASQAGHDALSPGHAPPSSPPGAGLDALNAAVTVIGQLPLPPSPASTAGEPVGDPTALVQRLRNLLRDAVRRSNDSATEDGLNEPAAQRQLAEDLRPYRAALERCFVTGSSLPVTTEVVALVEFYLRATGALGASDPPPATASIRDTLLVLPRVDTSSRAGRLVDELVEALGAGNSPADEVLVALAHYRQVRERFGVRHFFERLDRTSRMMMWLATFFPPLLGLVGFREAASATSGSSATASPPPVSPTLLDLVPLAVVEARTLADAHVRLQNQARTDKRLLERARATQQASERELAAVRAQLQATQQRAADLEIRFGAMSGDLIAAIGERDRLRGALESAAQKTDEQALRVVTLMADNVELARKVRTGKQKRHTLREQLKTAKEERDQYREKAREAKAQAKAAPRVTDAQVEKLYSNSWRLGRVFGQPDDWYRLMRAALVGPDSDVPSDWTVQMQSTSYDPRPRTNPPAMCGLPSYRTLDTPPTRVDSTTPPVSPARVRASSSATTLVRTGSGGSTLARAGLSTTTPARAGSNVSPATAVASAPVPATPQLVCAGSSSPPDSSATSILPATSTRLASAVVDLTKSDREQKRRRLFPSAEIASTRSGYDGSSSELTDSSASRQIPSRTAKVMTADAFYALAVHDAGGDAGAGGSVAAATSASAKAAHVKGQAARGDDTSPASVATPVTKKGGTAGKKSLPSRVRRPDDGSIWANMLVSIYDACIAVPYQPAGASRHAFKCQRVPLPFTLGAVRCRSSTVHYVDMQERQRAEVHGLATQGYRDQTPFFPNYRPSQGVGSAHTDRLLDDDGLDQYLAILADKPWDVMWRRRIRHLFLVDLGKLTKKQFGWLVDQLKFQFRWREAYWLLGHWLAISRAKVVDHSRWAELYLGRQSLVGRFRVAFKDRLTLPPGLTDMIWSEPAIWFAPSHECTWIVDWPRKNPLDAQLRALDDLEPIRSQWSAAPGRFVEALLPEQAARLSKSECWAIPIPYNRRSVRRAARIAYGPRDIDHGKYTAGYPLPPSRSAASSEDDGSDPGASDADSD